MEDDIITYLILGGIGLFALLAIMYYLYRWIFSIKRQLWNQKMQIELLMVIAGKLGADLESEDFVKLRKANWGRIDLY